MDASLTMGTWLWLLVPMPLVVVLSFISWLRHKARHNGGEA